MKNKLISKTCKQTILAVPAAALMLGASHGGTIAINYTENWGAYAANGTGTYGGYYGSDHYFYMTTGMNVTATAFGVPASSWSNIQLQYYTAYTNYNTVVESPGGPLTISTSTQDAWCSGIGNTNINAIDWRFDPATVNPGDDQVTWAYLDDAVTKTGYTMWNVNISGLKAAYPNGFTVQTIGYPWLFPAPNVNVTDGATFTNSLPYTSLGPRQGPWGTTYAGISAVSPVMTNDAITIFGSPPVNLKPDTNIYHSTLCGFIITDASSTPSMSLQVVGNTLVYLGGTLQSSPVLGPNAVWTTVAGAVSPYQILPSTSPSMFYRLASSSN